MVKELNKYKEKQNFVSILNQLLDGTGSNGYIAPDQAYVNKTPMGNLKIDLQYI